MSWFRPPGLVVMLAAVVVALVLVPGSMSATDSEAGAAAAGDPLDVALSYVGKHAAELGVTRADVAELFVTSNVRSAHSGVTHVNLNQRYQGLEVFGGHATVNVAAGGRVIFAAGSFVRGLGVGASGEADLGPTGAVQAAADGLDLAEPDNLHVLSRSGGAAQKTVLSQGGISDAPIPARLGWQPTKDGLRVAWQLTIDDSSDVNLWNATVDAETGELLDVDDWTSHDDLDDLASTLSRGSSFSVSSALSPPGTTNPVNDGSSYRVLELPKESPNDGPLSVVENPADAAVSPFGWHDTDGISGPEFTITRGNNAHAYMDQDNNNAQDFGGSPEGTSSLDFIFPTDLSLHAQAYRDAAVSNLFFWNNVFHDVTTLYGFDEAADNFQSLNYGGAGSNGDYVRAEAADGGGTNNANFSTPAAGGTPRMQMYLWPGNQFGSQNQVTVPGLGDFGASWSRFGPATTNAGTSGAIVLVNDGTALPTEGCGPLVGFPADAIALVDRGTCTFLQKVENAQAAGASAVIIANNVAGTPPVLTGSMVAAPPSISAVSVTQVDGNAIKAALPAMGTVRKHPTHPGIRDGDLENGIIIHEYGHGVSNRLTGGPGKPSNCLGGNDEQMGEGWSDYVAITVLLDPALDDPNGPRGMGPYALFQNSRQGNGIRPRPYSRNMTIQPFTYDSIKTNGWLNGATLALPHGLGHGWASVLWDLNWDLIDKHGFNPNIYEDWDTGGNNRAFQYVIDGMKMQGCGPGIVVGSRAIIAATEALGGEDTCTTWATFSRRGLGFSAVQGSADNRNDNTEAFDTHPACRRGFQSPVTRPYGALNEVDAGDAVPLKFTADGYRQLDVLKDSGSPFSRKVNCSDLRVPSENPAFITPRELPVATVTPGGSTLTVNSQGVFHYNWKTPEEWAGTCREVVLTRDDGKQHRAFFRFL